MSSTPWEPFSVRIGRGEPWDEAPYDGVPDHLLSPLQGWVDVRLMPRINGAGEARLLTLRLRLVIDPYSDAVSRLVGAEGFELLDIVDALLAGGKIKERRRQNAALAVTLDVGGSAYRVNDAMNGLELRIEPTVKEAVGQTLSEAAHTSAAGSAADHLSSAWQAVYGIHPDPVRGYSEAIKAVESAAHAVIEPKNAKATLGSMLRVIRNARHKFTTVIPAPAGAEPIIVVETMMQTLWEGQTSRHGGQSPTVPETLEAARAGVHLAASLVQWFSSGAVTRTA